MSFRFRGKRRGPRAALMTGALIAAMLGVATQSASASCPSGGRVMTEWLNVHEERGVTVCEGMEPLIRSGASGYLQVVDLRAGAGIQLQARGEFEDAAYERWRLEGEIGPKPPESYSGEPYGLFSKYTANEWFTSIGGSSWERGINRELSEPDPSRLFSVTNASLFTDPNHEDPRTTMTLPMETWWGFGSAGVAIHAGCRDAAYKALKKVLIINEPHQVSISSFRQYYRQEDVESISHTEGAAVGYAPEVRVGEGVRRTYLGVYENFVYIFTSTATYTNANAAAIMQEIQPGMEVMQLDGGDSTQFYSRYAEVRSTAPTYERQVPDVIAVYTS